MRAARTSWLRQELPRRLFLPCWSDAVDADRSRQVPSWLLLPCGNMHSCCLWMWAQVSCGIVPADKVPATILLLGDEQRQYDAVPDRIQLRGGGYVRAESVLSGVVRVVRGQEVVRPLLAGALLPDGDIDHLVPGGVVLPPRRVGADAVPCEPVLPARVGQAEELSSAEEFGSGVQVGRSVQVRSDAAPWPRRPSARAACGRITCLP